MLKRLYAVLLSILFLFPSSVYAKDAEISAASAIAVDASSGTIFYERNIYKKMPMASTTKIMTCLIACESKRLDKIVTVTDEMLYGTEGSLIYLKAGDKITLCDLVKGAMIASGNDAANVIAFYLSGSLASFVRLMNERAQKLKMTSTYFETPSGLDKGKHRSTAFDMALLAAEALKNPELLEIAKMKSAKITINGKVQTIYNHNKLLSFDENFIGLKTGYTKKAGRCLVSAYEYNGSKIICVTLSAPDDWEDHKTLVSLSKKCYKDIKKREEISINAVGGTSDTVSCGYEYSVSYLSDPVIKEYYYPFLYAPAVIGDIVGKAEIYIDNELVKTVDITVKEDLELWQITN